METYRHAGIVPVQGECIDVYRANHHLKPVFDGAHQPSGREISVLCVDLVTLSSFNVLTLTVQHEGSSVDMAPCPVYQAVLNYDPFFTVMTALPCCTDLM